MSANPKEIIFEEEARKKLLSGIKQLAKAVRHTLGPSGRNVSLEKGWGSPAITNDGNSILKEIDLKDQFENMGAAMAKEVAAKIKEKCGDGTTTGTLLLAALVENGFKNITSGASPIGIKRGIDKAVEAVLKAIDNAATPVSNNADIQKIATVSASGNKNIGDLIGQAIEKVGQTGVITIEEAKGTETTIETVEGMQFDRGYLSPYFCTNPEKMTVEMEDAAILIIDKKVSAIQELLPILQSVAATGKALLIIAEDMDGDALATLVVNKLRGTLRVAAVRAPGFGDRRKAMLQDLAILTNATVVSDETGTHLKDATQDVLGGAEKITINKDTTTVVNGKGEPARIASRVKQIEAEIVLASNSYEAEKLQERKAKLSGGIAVIRVGAATEPEMKQKKQMFEDSLNSTKAAVAEGIVAGGGVALLRASLSIQKLKLEGDEAVGAKIVALACESPLRQIVANSGLDSAVILAEIESTKKAKIGFNALTGKVEDMFVAGIVDPAKVIKTSLAHAASAAGIVLLSEGLIGDAEEDEKEKSA